MDIKEMESIIEQKDKELRKLSHELMLALRGMLTKWTDEELAVKLDKMLGFNPTNMKVEMMGALIEYMYSKERHTFKTEFQRTMFKLMCKRFDKYQQEQLSNN